MLWPVIGSVIVHVLWMGLMMYASFYFRPIYTDILGEDAELPLITNVFIQYPGFVFVIIGFVLIGQGVFFARSDRLRDEGLSWIFGQFLTSMFLWWTYLVAVFLPLIRITCGLWT